MYLSGFYFDEAMADEKQDLTKIVAEFLNQISYIENNIVSEKSTLLSKLEEKELDSQSIENIFFEFITVLKKLKGNIFFLLDSLNTSISDLYSIGKNINIEKLRKAIVDCRVCDTVNSEVNYEFIGIIKQNTNASAECENGQILLESGDKSDCISLQSDKVDDDRLKNSCNHSPVKKKLSLSLIKDKYGNSQDTDDEGWVDTIGKKLGIGK